MRRLPIKLTRVAALRAEITRKQKDAQMKQVAASSIAQQQRRIDEQDVEGELRKARAQADQLGVLRSELAEQARTRNAFIQHVWCIHSPPLNQTSRARRRSFGDKRMTSSLARTRSCAERVARQRWRRSGASGACAPRSSLFVWISGHTTPCWGDFQV